MADKGNTESSTELYDVAIVGGGMVGSSLALALARLPISVVLIEPFEPTSDQAPGFDARAIALSRATAKILHSLNLWDEIKPKATAIEHIHVSDKGRPGLCQFSAKEVNIPAMGYVVELQDVGKVMHKALQSEKLTSLCPAKVSQITQLDGLNQLSISETNKERKINARLVVAADGNRSSIRDMLNIGTTEKPYQQSALISTIQTQKPHNHWAFERFTDIGPVALLPLSDNRISLVWMLPPEQADEMLNADEDEFTEQLQQAFGQRLGRITRIGERHCYPLNLVQTQSDKQAVVFIGNAAQSLHPIAGQGFNLGLRDVADLVDVLRQACIDNKTVDDPEVLDNYLQLRAPDRNHIVTMTDSFARLFSNPSPILSIPRNTLLGIMSLLPEARHEFTRFAMGMNHKASRLTRGLAIEVDARP